jgi:beta-glucanase (GH16 family)
MNRFYVVILLLIIPLVQFDAQNIEDDFEGNGTITTWFGDDCSMDNNFSNPYQTGINTSNTVLRYNDIGGQYANVRFDSSTNFDLTAKNTFKLKIYVPSSSVTGSNPNQISLKLQDGTLEQPWTTQSEIIKPIVLDQWQEVFFNFEEDNYINLDNSSVQPIGRTDFNRVVLQVNGENNNYLVTGYIDDLLYFESTNNDPIFDNLVWFDEFNGEGALDHTKWYHQTEFPIGNSWFNGEIQHYTNRLENSYQSGGNLIIVAKKESFNDQGVTKQYTSARLNSKFAFTYGRVEIRAKLPLGIGTWPALWMLGQNINENGAFWETQGFGNTSWPDCGEVDIMEHWGENQDYIQSAMHTPSSSGGTTNFGGQTITNASSQFHVYELEWWSEKMVFSVDGVVHYTYNPPVKDANTWPFDLNQYLLFNVAILPNIDLSFTESTMEIDYVRIYQESALSNTEVTQLPEANFYPNPMEDHLNIRLPSELFGVNMSMYTIFGQLLISQTLNESITSINISNLSSGLYIVSLNKDNQLLTHKVVKK